MSRKFSPAPRWSRLALGWGYQSSQQSLQAHVWKGQDGQWFGAIPGKEGFLGPWATDLEAKQAVERMV